MSAAPDQRIGAGRINVTRYDSQPFDDNGSFALSVVTTAEEFSGDLVGGGSSRLIVATKSITGTVRFTGIERFTGTLAGRAGSFLFENSGTLEKGALHSTWRILPGSGTGELKWICGEGGCNPDGYQLAYWFDSPAPLRIDAKSKRD